MAASNERLILFKRHHKYCCDPVKEHKSRRAKDLRNVTDRQAQEHPSLVSIEEKICSSSHAFYITSIPVIVCKWVNSCHTVVQVE